MTHRMFFNSVKAKPYAMRYWPYSTKRLHDAAKRDALALVCEAIRTGQLKRLPCEVCRKRLTEAHHDDYSEPLQVRWLCRKHHRARHREMGTTPSVVSAPKQPTTMMASPSTLPLITAVTHQVLDLMAEQGVNASVLSERIGSSRQYTVTLFDGGIRTFKALASVADALGYDITVHFEKRRQERAS